AIVHAAQELTRRIRVQRTAEQEALRVLTLLLLQEGELRKVLHAFGGHVDTQRARHGDDRRGDGAVITALADTADERAFYLQAIDREVAQAHESRVAGAEIIDGQRHAELLELVDRPLR